MNRIPFLVLAATMLAAIVVIAATAASLPPQVASHFGWPGTPDGWSGRDAYLAMMIAQVIGEPLLLVAVLVGLPRVAPRTLNVPHRDAWLAPARRDATLRRLGTYASVLGCIVVVFLTLLHLAVVRANTGSAAGLPMEAFVPVVVAFVVAIAVWVVSLHAGFKTAP